MSGSINFSGLSSGIDTNSIIQEMLTIDRQPETVLKDTATQIQQQQAAYGTISAQLLTLQGTANVLDNVRAFDLVTATEADNTVATVTAQTGAQSGAHTVTVNSLAAAQRISTAGQSSETAPLNYTGQIIINGKAINVQASDSLDSLASNINAAGAGVTASILSPSPNKFYLTLNSNNTGLQGQINISDTGGNATPFLGTTLGMFGSGATLAHSVSASVAGSGLFADSATSIATLEGQTAVPPTVGSVSITATVNGSAVTKNVSIDLSKSLSGIAADINTAFGNPATAVAQVAAVTDPISGNSAQQLQINGVSGASAFTDNNNVLANLGILQRSYGTDPSSGSSLQLTAAQDASFTLDGLAATRPTNSFSDAISNLTINLLKAGTTDFSVSSDTATIKTNINAFVTQFNTTVDTINGLSQYDATSGTTDPLFGDLTAESISNNLASNVINPVSGLPSSTSLLSQIGITLDQNGHLNVDDTALSSALANNLNGVAQLFQANGTTSNPTVQFVSSTSDTQPSPPAGYAVNVTQPATQATVSAGNAQTKALASDETLTFGGALFGTGSTSPLTGGYSITLPQGSSLADVVSQINGDSHISPILSASIVNGKLTLTAKQYGSNAQFAVVSSVNDTGTGDNTGLGNTVISQAGLDVAGTINGEPATGVGQFLTGSLQGSNGTGNGQALGLQLRVTATAPGSYGTVSYTSGIADITKNYINTQTDTYSGALTTANAQLQQNYNDIQDQITQMEAQITSEQTTLQEQFTNMETVVGQLKSAGDGLAALGVTISSGSGSSSSSSTGSTTSSTG